MSNEFVVECLRHKDNRHIQTRLDYLFLFRNETMAKIIRIMETWTNQKRAEWYKATLDSKEQGKEPPEEELWVTMSYEQFSLFAFETIKHDTIKEAVDDLVESEYLGRRPHPDIPYGPPQYLLNTPMLQHRLNIQEIPALDGRGIILPPRKKHTPQEKYPQGRGKDHRGDPGKIPPPRGENTPPSNNTTKNSLESSKNEGTYGANAPTRPLVVHPEYNFLAFDDLQHPTIMVIYFVDDDRAEVTNKARGWTAQGVVETLASQGIQVQVRKEKEHNPAHLKEIVDEKLEEVEEELERISGELPAVHSDNETQYHIANSAIGNEEGELVLTTPGRLTLPARIGATHGAIGNDTTVHHGSGMGYNHDDHHTEDHKQITSQQAPGTPAPLPSAVGAPVPTSRHGDTRSVQAQPLSAPTPAQAGSNSPATSTLPAQASGFVPPRRPRQKRPPVMPPEPPKVTLTTQEQVFWSELWCKLFFNKDITPDLTPTAYRHLQKLAPHITTAEQLESLVKKARKDLEDNTGVKRKTVYLGNCVNSYPGWKQEQAAAQSPPEDKPVDKYTAASKDKERLERGLQRLRDLTIAEGRGGELPK